MAALLTSQIHRATTMLDYLLQDWSAAGLLVPTAYRPFIETFEAQEVIRQIGRLSDRDWGEVQARLRLAIAI
jgi:hypothetical protein